MPAGRGAMTASRAPGTPCPRSTRSNGSCRPRPGEPVAEPGLQPVPHQLRGALQHRLLASARCSTSIPRSRPGTARWSGLASTSRRRRPRTTRTPGRSSRRSSATRTHPAAVHRHDLLADEQGLAEPAVGPVQQRRRPGRQLLRRAGGQRRLHALYALDNGTVTLDNLSNTSPVRAVGGGQGVQPGRQPARRPDGEQHHARQPAGANSVLTPKVPTRRSPAQVYFVELLLQQNGTRSTATSTGCPRSRTWSLVQDTRQAAGHDVAVRQPAGARRRCRQSAVTATAATRSQSGPDGADRASTVTITNTSSSTVAFLLRADVRRGTATGRNCPGTTSCSRRSGRATTSRCSPASRRRSPSPGTPLTCKAPPRSSACPAGTSPRSTSRPPDSHPRGDAP